MSRGACRRLLEYDWPGNVRQLHNVLWRAVKGPELAKKGVLQAADLERALREERTLRELRDVPSPGFIDPMATDPWLASDGRFRTLEEMERLHLREALKRTDGNVSQAAQLLGIPRTTLQHRMKRLG